MLAPLERGYAALRQNAQGRVAVRTGIETFTGAYHRVVFDQDRADHDLPPWRSVLADQYFTDSEVQELPSPTRGDS